jgi:hypothetical protein
MIGMNPSQHQKIALLMENLTNLQERMIRTKNVFPNHYAHLLQSYNRLLMEAREAKILPPWMVG